MLNQVFYHSTLRKYIILFGNLFDDIVVRRFDAANNEAQNITVPISYSPKQKWLYMLSRPQMDQTTAIQLPRLGFEIVSIIPDIQRKINPLNKIVFVTSDKNKMLHHYSPIPYKLGIELYSITKNADDAAQITEQIIPFFNPDFTATLDLIPELDKKYDIRTNLTSIGFTDAYENTFQERRAIIWTYNFELDVWFFGPIQKQGVIKRVQVDLIPVPGSGPVTDEEVATYGRTSRIVVKPGLTADGKPTSNAALSIPYRQIDADDDYGFIEEFYTFEDGRKYNSRTGEDV